MKNKYNKMFKAGKRAQLPLMIKNEHKKGWDDINLLWAVKKIQEHLLEMYNNSVSPQPTFDLKRLRKLAADVANLAQMIILKCDKEILK